jgi:thiamine-phosphate pyrophosphorylase
MIGYYFITDAALSRAGNISDIKNAVAAKVKYVQYREKQLSTEKMYIEAKELRKVCKNIFFLINDRVDIALSVGADGVHLGQEDLPYRIARKLLGKEKIIGMTVHNIKEAEEAEKLGADYLSVSPIFTTQTKLDASCPVGVALIKKIKGRIRLPVVAIGGIDLVNAPEVIRAGADGLCAISAVVKKRDVKQEIKKFQNFFRHARYPHFLERRKVPYGRFS